MTSVDSNFKFLCGRPHGAGPPSPVHMHPAEPDPLPPPCGRHKWMAPSRRPLFKHACVSVCMHVCVPVAHVKVKLTISNTYKLVLLHVAACWACITVSNCIIKQHNLRQ